MYREILTKAIIAKGNKKIIENHTFNTENNITKVLGCWIINHNHEVYIKSNKIYIKGSYDAHLWYGYDDNTNSALLIKTIEFDNEIPYNFTLEKSILSDKNELIDYVNTEPSCSKMFFEDNKLIITIERIYDVDIIGETKIKIKVDDVIIDEMINTNYVNDNKQWPT